MAVAGTGVGRHTPFSDWRPNQTNVPLRASSHQAMTKWFFGVAFGASWWHDRHRADQQIFLQLKIPQGMTDSHGGFIPEK